VAQRVTELPAANLDYSVAIADGAQPVTSNGQIAAIARHYLDEQTPELAAPGIHVAPRIVSVTATLARSAHDSNRVCLTPRPLPLRSASSGSSERRVTS